MILRCCGQRDLVAMLTNTIRNRVALDRVRGTLLQCCQIPIRYRLAMGESDSDKAMRKRTN